MSDAAADTSTVLTLQFKDAMRRLASTVAIITTSAQDRWHGMAATAVTSISSTPPCLLIAVNRAASLHAPVSSSRRFCVNLLDASQHALVDVFSGAFKGTERFNHGVWAQDADGLPYLDGAAANLFCDLDVEVNHATHTLFIGAVSGVVTQAVIDPLVWVNGSASRVAPI